MNERIRILAEQATTTVSAVPNESMPWTYFDTEKFAQLIVRECMSKLYLNGYDDAMIQLQKDFGLGE